MSSEFDLRPRMAWATTFFFRKWRHHEAEASGILQHLYELKERFQRPIDSGIAVAAKSRYGIFESDFDLLASEHPGLVKLRGFIGATISSVVAQMNGGEVDPRRLKVVITDSWFHITNDGGFHDAHYHGGCSWCGIYYVQSGDPVRREDSRQGAANGVNRFYCPLPTGGTIGDYGNHYLDNNRIDVPPEDGMLLIFPSYLLHSAIAYRGQKDRVIISFNSQTLRDE